MNGGELDILIKADDSQLRAAAERARSSFDGIATSAQKSGAAADGAMKKLGAAVAGYFSIQAAANFARQIVGVRQEVESLEISFNTLLGSQEKSAALMQELTQFASSTPLQLTDLAKGAQTLLAFNVSAEKVMPILKSIGDISMGDAGKLQSLTLAFAQMSSTGKLMGQDLLQMINAGFNPLSVISEQTGKSIATLKDEMSKGKISADQITQAFIDATSEGGKFYGMLDKMSNGLAGSFSNLKSAINDMMNELGRSVQGPIVDSVKGLTELVRNYKKVGETIADIAIVFGTYKAAIMAVTATQKILAAGAASMTAAELAQYGAITMVEKAQKLLNKTMLSNPYVLAATAIAAMAIALTKNIKLMRTSEKLHKDMAAAADKAAATFGVEKTKLENSLSALNKAKKGTKEYESAINSIKNEYGDYLNDLKIEADTLKDSAENQEALRKAIINTTRARIGSGLKEEISNMMVESTSTLRGSIDKIIGRIGLGLNDATVKAIASNAKVAMSGTSDNAQKWLDAQIARLRKLNEERNGAMKYSSQFQTPWQIEENNIIRFQAAYQEFISSMKMAEDEMMEIDKLYGSTSKKVAEEETTTTTTTTGNINKQKKDYAAKEQELAQARIDAIKDSEFEVRQAEIDAMDESTEKKLKQIDLNYDRQIEAIERKEREFKAANEEIAKAQWLKNNPEGDVTKIDFPDELTKEQQAVINGLKRVADTAKNSSLNEITREVLDKFQTYEQQRNNVFKEFEDAVKAMTNEDGSVNMLAGFSQGNIAEAERKRDEALKAIDKAFASRNADFNAWTSYITNLSIGKLELLLAAAQQKLQEAEDNVTSLTDEQMAVLRAQVAALSEQLANLNSGKNLNKSLEVSQKTIAKMDAAQNVISSISGALHDVTGMFDELDDVAADSFHTIIDFCEQAITTMVELSKQQTETMGSTDTSQAESEVKNIAKSADWITMIIKAVISLLGIVVRTIKENNKSAYDVVRKKVDDVVDYTNDRLNNIRFYEAFDAIKDALINSLDVALDDIDNELRNIGTTEYWISVFSVNDEKRGKAILSVINDIAEAYSKTSTYIDQFDDKLQLYVKQLIALEANVREAEKEYVRLSNNVFKEKAAEKANQELKQAMREQENAMRETVEYIRDYMADVFGGDAQSLAEKFGDALIDAFSNGENAAKAFGDTVKDVMKQIARNLVIQSVITPVFEGILDKYRKELMNSGIEDGNIAKWWMNNLQNIFNDFDAAGEGLIESFEELPEDIKEYLGFNGSSSGSSKGIAQASQDSIDELNGRMTAIQLHTSILTANSKIITENTNAIMMSVRNIETTVRAIGSRVDNMGNSLNAVRDDVRYLRSVGIKAL